MSGIPRVIDKVAVLQVIHDRVTKSPSELVKNLNVDRATVYRRMKEINQEEIDQALGVITEGDLKPADMQFDLFSKILEVKRFAETLQFVRKTTEKYANKNVRMLYRVCILLKKKPSALTPQMVADVLVKIRKKSKWENLISEKG